jgi:osmotically-inducible protein OsmY
MADRELKPHVAIALERESSGAVVEPRVRAADVRSRIEAAFTLCVGMDARRVSVVVYDGTVILIGAVRSWAEREEAERAAWAAPGVIQVDDRLSISPS